MMPLEPLISLSDLKTELLEEAKINPRPLVAHYDDLSDTLILQIVPLEVETVVHYADDQVGLIFQDADMQVVGIQIEDFVSSFLPKHDKVTQVRQVKLTQFGNLFVTAGEVNAVSFQDVIKAAGDNLGEMTPKLIDAVA